MLKPRGGFRLGFLFTDKSNRFLPYIQPYEFEGLLFSDVKKLIEVDSDWDSNLVEQLHKIKNEFETPEHINNSKETSPSHRLQSLLKYQKKLHGPLAIENIGIDKVLSECKHFQQWYNKLLALKSISSLKNKV